jgi:16S rRNA (guanine(966)-N(2))-methyltransferase RsmD
METRPTSDRLRETLFNILAPHVDGSRFVDLYAGTGAVGIEALSRGASHVWFAEKAAPALASIRQNLAALKISRGFTLEDRGVGALLQRLVKLTEPVDLVYVDPPYEAEAEYTGTLNFFGSARGRSMLAPDALVIAEHSSKNRLAARYGELEHMRLVKQGDAALSFFAFAAAGSPLPDAVPSED